MKLTVPVVVALAMAAVAAARADDPVDSVSRTLGNIGQKVKERVADGSDREKTRKLPRRHAGTRQTAAEDDDAAEKTRNSSADAEPAPSATEKSVPTAKEDSPAARDAVDVPTVPPETPAPGKTEAAGHSDSGEKPGTRVTSLQPDEIKEFSAEPPKVQAVLREALALTGQNLAYTYGSDDPAKGGMDCSGFVSYVLRHAGYSDVPRDSSEQYLWVRKHGKIHDLPGQDGQALAALKPADLLFWSGTYTIKRDVPITHVMIYLGTGKKSGKPLMVGASEGRSYAGVRQFGVSVFDFKLPTGQPANGDPGRTPKFEGYATIPGVRPGELADNEPEDRASVQPSATPRPPEPLSNGD